MSWPPTFTHWDSRSGDPQLHDHVVVLNRAKSVSDGKWRTLDSRTPSQLVLLVDGLEERELVRAAAQPRRPALPRAAPH